jgi:hypothetical protein
MTDDTKLDAPGESGQHDSERKLWFEYLTKLNDRELQMARASGATSWLLLAVAAGIAYRSLSGFKQFTLTPDALTTAAIVCALLFDIFSHFWSACLGLFYYCGGKVEGRLLPDLGRRAQGAWHSILQVGLLALGLAHFALSRSSGPAVPRRTLIVFGLLWVANSILGLGKRVKEWRRAKRLRIPAVVFQALPLSPALGGLGMGVYALTVGALATFLLCRYLAWLNSLSIDWTEPLRVAGEVLVFAVLLLILLRRGLYGLSRGIYLELERDVLLRHLTPAQIEQRFIDEAVGPSVADWLRKLRTELTPAQADLMDAIGRFLGELTEIESIDPSYSIERAERARRLQEEYSAQVKDHVRKTAAVKHQFRQFKFVAGSVKTGGVIKSFLNEWEVELDRTIQEANEALTSLQNRLSAFYGQAGGGRPPERQ